MLPVPSFVKITDLISAFLYADCLMDSCVDRGLGWQWAKCIMGVEVSIRFWQKETSHIIIYSYIMHIMQVNSVFNIDTFK